MGARTAVLPYGVLVCGILTLAAAVLAGPAVASAPLRAEPAAAAGQVMVQLAPGSTAAELRRLALSRQATVVHSFRKPGAGGELYLLRPRSKRRTAAWLAAALVRDDAVVRAVPDTRIAADVYPNDTDYRALWGLYVTDEPLAWDLTTGSDDVVVAVIDSGADYGHADLAANMWRNPGEIPDNGIDDEGDGYVDDIHGIDAVNHDVDPYDDGSHGTGVAGIIGAVGNNSLGLTGGAWQVKIMALKALGANLVGTNSTALECIDYAIRMKTDYGVNVVAINASWGGSPYPEDPLLRLAIEAAGQAGIVWCASAGNDGRDNDAIPRYPSSYDVPTILAVAASDVDDQLPSWSNYGTTSVDLAAPGDNIKLLKPGDLYGWSSGTSMAAPDVGGVLALSAALYPNETALQRVDRILSGVEPIPAAEGKVLTGGRLNAYRSLVADLSPVTSVSGVPGGWSTAPVIASFSAGDGTGIGVERTEYSLDGSPFQPGAEATVATDGEHGLLYRSVDKAANVEPARSVAVKVDGTAPELAVSGVSESWVAGPVAVLLEATDATSGIAALQYEVDGGGFVDAHDATADFTVAGEGAHEVRARASDVAGNGTGEKAYAVRVDSLGPAVGVAGADDLWHAQPVTVHVTATDPNQPDSSGVSRIDYRESEVTWTGVAGPVADIVLPANDVDGVRTCEIRAVDAAGNVSTVQTVAIRIDRRPPTTAGFSSTATTGRPGYLSCRVADALPGSGAAVVTRIIIRNSRGIAVRSFSPDRTVPVNQSWTYGFLCSLAPGAYTFVVQARDLAGNAANRVAAGALTVQR